MKLADLWHLITTSRYTRQLERENAELREQFKELKRENHALIFALGRKPAMPIPADELAESPGAFPTPTSTQAGHRTRPGKRRGFSQIKRELESQEAPFIKGA